MKKILLSIALVSLSACSGGGGLSPLAPGVSGSNPLPSPPSTATPSQIVTPGPTATPYGPVTLNPPSISLGNQNPKTAMFTASQPGNPSTFSQSNTCFGIATISQSGATFKVTQIASGSCSVIVTGLGMQSATESITSSVAAPPATPSPIVFGSVILNPPSLALGNGNPTSANFTATQSNNSANNFSQTNNCSGIATISQSGATFTATQIAAGSCSVVVTGLGNKSATETITSQTPPPGPLTATPSQIYLGANQNAQPAPTTAQIVVSDAYYTGNISETDTCAGIVSITPASASGPSATFAVTQIKGGNCSIQFSDTVGQSTTVYVTSTSYQVISR